MTPQQIADILSRTAAAHGGGSDGLATQMSVLATGSLCMGAGSSLTQRFMQRLGDPDTVASNVRSLWAATVASSPFLIGFIDPLIQWTRRESEHAMAAALFAALADVDLVASTSAADGELLGPVYSILRSAGSQQANGAFFTPMSLAMLTAQMAPASEGESVSDPACGAGALMVAAARHMRDRGLDPATCSWAMNDLDPLAVSLTGVNAVIHGVGLSVRLSVSDALASA